MGLTFEDSFAQTITIESVSQISDDNTLALLGANESTPFMIGTSTYVAVSTFNEGVQILDVSTPSSISAVSQINDNDSRALQGANGIVSFKIGTSTYVAVSAEHDNGVQILDVSTPSAITAVSQITDNDTRALATVQGLTSFKIGSSTYLAVTAFYQGVQILDVSTPSSISAISKIGDDGTRTLGGATGITSFKIGSSTYLAVTSSTENGVQILDVSTPSSISAISQITDNGTRTLAGPAGVTSFKIGSSTYLAVTSSTENGVQILDVSTPSSISAISQITDNGSRTLGGANGIISFKIGSSTYVAVTARNENGVQILDVSTPSSISTVSQITDNGKRELDGAHGITSFKIDSSTYLAVPSNRDHGVEILKLNQPPIANAGRDITGYFGKTITLDGSSSTDPDGDTLGYTWVQNSTDTNQVELTDAGLGRVTFTAPDEPATLEFTLTVSDNSLRDTDTVTVTITKPISRNIKEMGDTLVSAKITAPNQITMTYNEELSTFINSYLNFTISGEDKPRSITGINGSPAIETGETVRINGKQVKTYSTTLTFDGYPVPAGSTGTMYMQHADHYLALIQVSDGQN